MICDSYATWTLGWGNREGINISVRVGDDRGFTIYQGSTRIISRESYLNKTAHNNTYCVGVGAIDMLL